MDELKASGKPFRISKQEVWDAWIKVKGNKGAPGVDGQSMEDVREGSEEQSVQDLESDVLGDVLPASGEGGGDPEAAWRRDPNSRGAHCRGQGRADRGGGPAGSGVEPVFHPDSYGYRPGRSPLDAVGACRERCWEYDWVIDLDIRKFFDSVRGTWSSRPSRRTPTWTRWVVLYVKRWLAAAAATARRVFAGAGPGDPAGISDFTLCSPTCSCIMRSTCGWSGSSRRPEFERYADDAVIHCVSENQARKVLAALHERMAEVGLELHPDKTKIVYCKDSNRRGSSRAHVVHVPRVHVPAAAGTAEGRGAVHLVPARDQQGRPEENQRRGAVLAAAPAGSPPTDRNRPVINPKVRGWMNYYGAFLPLGAVSPVPPHQHLPAAVDHEQVQEAQTWKKAIRAMAEAAAQRPRYFAHWAWVKPARQMTRTTRAV